MSRETPRVLIHNDRPDPMAERLAEVMSGVDREVCDSYAALPEMLSDFKPDVVYSVRFDGTPNFPTDAFLGPNGPAWISVGGSGCDHLGQWDPDRVTVTNAAGVAAGMMAEYVFGCVLHFTLDIGGLQRDKEAKVWAPRLMTTLAGKTMLIVGLGHTGEAVARRAKAFDMTVIGTRARPTPTPNVDEVHSADALPTLWERADVIVVCVPLLPATRGLIDARAFAKMKSSALIVDISRGGVMDQDALVNALRTGAIAGAALDVFETEPLPSESPVWSAENALLSPHCSSVYEGWEMASFDLFLENLARWRQGQTLENIVNPVRGY